MGAGSKVRCGGEADWGARAPAKSAETNLGAAGKNACATVGDGLSFLWVARRAMGALSKVMRGSQVWESALRVVSSATNYSLPVRRWPSR